MTITVPCLLMTRQRSQIGFTEGRTFIFLPVSVGDPASCQVVRRELDLHLVAGENSDVVLAHLSGNGCKHAVSVIDLHPKHRARKRFDDLAFYLDFLFALRHPSHGNRARWSAVMPTARAHSSTRCAAAGNRSSSCPFLASFDHLQPAESPEIAARSTSGAVVRIRGPSAVIATVCSK